LVYRWRGVIYVNGIYSKRKKETMRRVSSTHSGLDQAVGPLGRVGRMVVIAEWEKLNKPTALLDAWDG